MAPLGVITFNASFYNALLVSTICCALQKATASFSMTIFRHFHLPAQKKTTTTTKQIYDAKKEEKTFEMYRRTHTYRKYRVTLKWRGKNENLNLSINANEYFSRKN